MATTKSPSRISSAPRARAKSVASSEKIAELRARLSSALSKGKKIAVSRTAQVGQAIKKHPYRTAAIAAGVATVVGLVIARKRRAAL